MTPITRRVGGLASRLGRVTPTHVDVLQCPTTRCRVSMRLRASAGPPTEDLPTPAGWDVGGEALPCAGERCCKCTTNIRSRRPCSQRLRPSNLASARSSNRSACCPRARSGTGSAAPGGLRGMRKLNQMASQMVLQSNADSDALRSSRDSRELLQGDSS